jgi:hypothetical protein
MDDSVAAKSTVKQCEILRLCTQFVTKTNKLSDNYTPALDLLDDLVDRGELAVWLCATAHDFKDQHAVTPHIARFGKLVFRQNLNRRPTNW